MVAKHGAQNQLHVEHKDREQGQREQRGTALVEFGARLLLNPALAGEHRDGDGDAEKCLSQGRVRAGNCRRKEKQDGQPAQNALHDHRGERRQSQKAQPAPLFGYPGPDRQNDGQEPDKLPDYPMRMFVANAANPLRKFVKRTIAGRPIGDG